MDKNIVIWSCNKRKFVQIVATGEYLDQLVYKWNSTWFLVIKSMHSYMPEELSYPRWKIFLKREGGTATTTVIAKLVQGTSVRYYGGTRFPPRSESQICSLYWKNYVDCELDIVLIFEENDTDDCSSSESLQISKLDDLSNDMQSMLVEEHNSDVTVKCGSFITKAHKNILSARSPVFKAMFMNPMQESKEDVVLIKDMEPEVCRGMLNFMYSGKIKNVSTSKIYDLLYAAEKYQMKDLKCGCLEYLKSIMSDENVLQILEVADLYDKELETSVIRFISNRFNHLKTTEDWESFRSNNPLLALKVYSHVDQNN